MALVYKNIFFNNNMVLKKYNKLEYNEKFRNLQSFIKDEAFFVLNKRLKTEIYIESKEKNVKEYILLKETLTKEFLLKYNKQMVDNLISFYDINKNEKVIEGIFEENKKKLDESFGNIKEKYFSDLIEVENEEKEGKYFRVSSFNESIVFFVKEIIASWLLKKNEEIEEKSLFFESESIPKISVSMYQDIYFDGGINKTFSINFKCTTNNYRINDDLVKKDFYDQIKPIDFYNLIEYFKTLKNQTHKENEKFLDFYFGNIYFKLNTNQAYLEKDFSLLLKSIGININKIKKLPDIDDFEEYLSISILQMYKLNLGIVK